MKNRKNLIANDLRQPKYRTRVVVNKKKKLTRNIDKTRLRQRLDFMHQE